MAIKTPGHQMFNKHKHSVASGIYISSQALLKDDFRNPAFSLENV